MFAKSMAGATCHGDVAPCLRARWGRSWPGVVGKANGDTLHAQLFGPGVVIQGAGLCMFAEEQTRRTLMCARARRIG